MQEARILGGAGVGVPPVTPDGRYLVVRGRLWRHHNPALSAAQRNEQVKKLMAARRALRRDQSGVGARRRARAVVHAAKVALGERGPVWWSDGAPDYNRHLVKNSPYRAWHQAVTTPAGSP